MLTSSYACLNAVNYQVNFSVRPSLCGQAQRVSAKGRCVTPCGWEERQVWFVCGWQVKL